MLNDISITKQDDLEIEWSLEKYGIKGIDGFGEILGSIVLSLGKDVCEDLGIDMPEIMIELWDKRKDGYIFNSAIAMFHVYGITSIKFFAGGILNRLYQADVYCKEGLESWLRFLVVHELYHIYQFYADWEGKKEYAADKYAMKYIIEKGSQCDLITMCLINGTIFKEKRFHIKEGYEYPY